MVNEISMVENMKQTDGKVFAQIGDTPQKIENPFHLHFSSDFRSWLAQENLSLALTTYEGSKLILIGSGLNGQTVVAERNFERCMALAVEGDRNIWLSTNHQIWKLENGLKEKSQLDGWDRVYLPRAAYVTGGVDIHDMAQAQNGDLFGVVTYYNCIARLGEAYGSFSPFWRPSFISGIVAEDRCHLNGFCMEDGKPAYASIVGVSDELDGWREHRNDGGLIVDMRTDEVVAEGLSMPHTPRFYNGKLWFLEGGRGWLCSIDPSSGNLEKHLWRPGFLRGLRFYGDYVFICSSKPRDKTFKGLPLDKELEKQGTEARCALDIIKLSDMSLMHSVEITGSVTELYDVALLEDCKQPLLYGIEGEDLSKIVVLGDDETGLGPLKKRT